MKKYKINIKGVSPLLFNRFSAGIELGPVKKKIVTTKEVQIEDKLYLLPNKKPYIPARYFEAAIIEAGKSFKGRGKSNLSKTMGAMMSVKPEAIPIITKKGWVEDVQVGVNPMTKGRMAIHRPRFDEWEAEFEVEVAIDEIPIDMIKGIMDHAGIYVGIGDWRPDKKGKYGKFIVSGFEEI